MIETICAQTEFAHVVVTEIAGERNVPAERLAEVFRRYVKAPVEAVPQVKDAFRRALEEKRDSMLFCVGSLYLVGELKGLLAKGL